MDLPDGYNAARVINAGQGQLYRWWTDLSAAEQLALQRQTDAIDFDELETALQEYLNREKADFNRLAPAQSAPMDGAISRQAEATGRQAIRNGEVCCLVLAGGLGTRLGFGAPKGLYPIGPITGKSLFQWFAEKIKFISRWAECTRWMPWLIMTSSVTHTQTAAFFQEQGHFGLGEEDVHFIEQGTIPAVDLNGKLLMDSKWHICENPDGHGGAINALGKSGVFEHLLQMGIEQIFVHNIDNPLVKVCDPAFLGQHKLAGADFSCKSLSKRSPDETLATIVRENGELRLVEYSDIPQAIASLRDEQGQLVYGNGSINTFLIRVDFIKRLYDERCRLPLHGTRKQIDSLDLSHNMDQSGDLLQSHRPDAIQFEKKLFDALLYTGKTSVMGARRAEEFSPLKNSQGLESPATVLHDLQASFLGWMKSSGIPLPEEKLTAIEISPSFAKDLPTFQARVMKIGQAEIAARIWQQLDSTGRISL
jgi:UDP-N-acetylglucosamine/UDP-N-acetylgalactosamine diphosphorylase